MFKIIKTFVDMMNTFNGLYIPVGNMGIPRSAMPQIDGKHQGNFKAFLKSNNVSFKLTQDRVKDLMLTQNEINKFKIIKLMGLYRDNEVVVDPIIISKDHFVLDGSHRFVALLNIDKNAKISTIKVDMNMVDLIKLAQKFQYAKYRNVSHNKLDT